MAIEEKIEQRWSVTIPGASGREPDLVVSSVDSGPSIVKVSVLGHVSLCVCTADLVELLKRVEAHVSGSRKAT